MNQIESKLQAITTSIAILKNSEKPNQTLLKSLRKERDNILNDLELNNLKTGKIICVKK